jgi:hypothetical protein
MYVERGLEPTPHGGSAWAIFYRNKKGSCDKSIATSCCVNEFDDKGNLIYSAICLFSPGGKK